MSEPPSAEPRIRQWPSTVMITDLKPYPAMKDSGVEWLGKVPEHWEVRRGKLLFRHRKQINADGGETNVLSLTLRGVVNNDPENPEGLVPKDYATYQLFRKGDLVFKLIDLENLQTSRVGLVHEDGIMSSAYVRLTPKVSLDIHFFYQQYFDLYLRGIYNQLGAGVRSTLGPYDLLELRVLLPPFPEQAKIVRYLDYVGRRVRQFVKAKQKLIGLLEEQKQAIIHRAVTRGLDPDVSLKDSGIEWLGETPEHWEIQPLKYWVHLNKSVLSENTEADFEFKYLDIGSVGMGILTEKPQRIRFSAAPSRARRIVRSGDTLVSTVRTYLKAVWFADEQNDDLIASTGFAVLSPNLNTAPKYVSYLVQSDSFTNRVTAESVGIAYPAIPESKLAKFKVAIPPLAEQTIIVEHLNKATANIDAIIAHTRREIALLQEYHTRLTADVVTGKVDVRGAAANLPDEVFVSASPRAPDVPETKTGNAVEESRT